MKQYHIKKDAECQRLAASEGKLRVPLGGFSPTDIALEASLKSRVLYKKPHP